MEGSHRNLHPLLFATFAICVGGCASMGNFSPLKPVERSMIYHPAAWPQDFQLPQQQPFEGAWFSSADGTKLHGLFVEHAQPQAIALVCHGNAGNVAGRMETLSILNREHRLSVMMLDYRGFGRSEGKPSEAGILADARAARKWLADRTGVSETEIVIMGRSLGGAVAVDLAAKDGAKALVLASTFTSLPEVAGEHFKWLPVQWLMTERLESINKLKDYHGPLLQTHGKSDVLVPIELGRKLFETAPGRKRFIEVEGGHNAIQPPEYREALEALLRSLSEVSSSGVVALNPRPPSSTARDAELTTDVVGFARSPVKQGILANPTTNPSVMQSTSPTVLVPLGGLADRRDAL